MDYILKKELFRQFEKGLVVVCLPNKRGYAIACYVRSHNFALRIRRDTFFKFLEVFANRMDNFYCNGEVYLKIHRELVPVDVPKKRFCHGK